MCNTNTPHIALPSCRWTEHGKVRSEAFISDSVLPTSADVVIIGAGICGIATAYFLAKQGLNVLVCEKGEVAAEASSRAFGWISELLNDPIKLPMARASKQIWRDLQGTEGEFGYREEGLVYLASSDEELAMYQAWLDKTADLNTEGNQLLSPEAVRKHLPDLKDPIKGGLFGPTDGSIEPTIATTRLASLARRFGAKIFTHCAVRTLDIKNDRIVGVYTEKGYVLTEKVLCAGNLWSRLFCGNHNIEVPQLYAIMSTGSISACDGPKGCGSSGDMQWAWRKQINGGYSLGRVADINAPFTIDAFKLRGLFKSMMDDESAPPSKVTLGRDALKDFLRKRRWRATDVTPFEKERIIQHTVNEACPESSLKLNRDSFSEMTNGKLDDTWSGPLTITPDGMPIASSVDQINGFYLLTGLSFGMTWAPALGKMMSEMMTNRPCSIDPKPFRLSRFYDGSEIIVRH